MKRGVAITGMGIISAIGTNVEENMTALLFSKTGIGEISNITTRHQKDIKVGEVANTNSQIAKSLQLPENTIFSRSALLGSLAAKQALENAQIERISEYRTGLVSSTTVGGMDLTEKHYKTFQSNPETLKYLKSHPAGDSTQKIAEQLGITEFVTTISTACSSAANAIMLGARLIKAGKLDRVIVGGTDCLSKFTINGFKTLMILSNENCTPFDANRKGLNLGEAAAYLVLESEAVIKKANKKVLGYVSGYANANDAFHQTASSAEGEGAFLAMQKALKVANLQPEEIDYINAHGTATLNNDLSESVAIKRIFGDAVPDFSSTKALTGHTLAAAGAIEAVYSIVSLQEQCVFPNVNFKQPIPELNIPPAVKFQKKKVRHVMSNSFGFGGNCSSLIFSSE
ncbi:beta-ketoacyl-[acyl-carrier-protein] synthase family protein [Cochleicola gelatinilyticus]|uniref:Beta-ACP synthase n=1 Tax=Cochleicola gelatinilyticus TaxID=1763537 RepID=A0A167JC74_9FLAO|nr:beta-ketoacyl-[acyl-carrier-protein] synthase family protein [Cochleicola gelatinilyticus]OAB80533.1 beta-ACP synthase [Cochleicola gelatinilyticus]